MTVSDETLRRVDAHRARRIGEVLREQTASVAPRPTGAAKPTTAEQFADLGLDGAAILADVERFLLRFVAYPSEHARVAHVLWIAHAHLMAGWESTPRLAFLSPEPASGKSRSLEVTELLVPRPVSAINATPAYLFRKVSDPNGTPTILFDEIDTVFGPKAKENEEIRGILNAGHRRGAMAGRCIIRGKTVETEELPAYCAVAMAGLGQLPDTILTRSIIVRMRRRAPGEVIEPYRRRLHAAEGHRLRELLATWARVVAPSIGESYPAMPAGVEDRAADCWEAPLTIAALAGGSWPDRAAVAAVALVAQSRESNPSLGVRLLADLRVVFDGALSLTTEEIITRLCRIEEAPWSDLKGHAIDARRLAVMLRPYGVASRRLREGASVLRGYHVEDLADPWQRYLPTPPVAPVADGYVESSRRSEGRDVPRPGSMGSADSATSATRATDRGAPGPDMPW
ncbi:MAG: DUF3631 domain-containing protein [Gammaproteobacteria bacterium]